MNLSILLSRVFMSSGSSVLASFDFSFLAGGLSFSGGGVVDILHPRKVSLFVMPSVGRVMSLNIRSSSGEGR